MLEQLTEPPVLKIKGLPMKNLEDEKLIEEQLMDDNFYTKLVSSN